MEMRLAENRPDMEKVISYIKQAGELFTDRTMAGKILQKGSTDFVTMVDTQVQEYLQGTLRQHWPHIQFMGEEKDNSEINFDGSVWILDPVDGTTNLIHDFMHPYVKHTTKIFSLRLMDFQAQAYPDARRKTRGACQLHRGGQSQSPVRPLCNRKQFS